MLELPIPRLGQVAGFTINCPDLDASREFYQKLGFTELFEAEFPFKLVEITDGQIQIMLRQSPNLYFAMTYYPRNIDAVAETLERGGIEFWEKANTKSDFIKRYITTTPEGVNVSLVQYIDTFVQPPGPTMLIMPQEDYFNPEKYVNQTIGMYGEIAHPTADLEATVRFWELLGFVAVSRYESPYPWAILSDGLNTVGMHQTTKFNYPAITYFAVNMAERIEKLREEGITPQVEEDRGNVTLLTPEGQHINLFTVGM